MKLAAREPKGEAMNPQSGDHPAGACFAGARVAHQPSPPSGRDQQRRRHGRAGRRSRGRRGQEARARARGVGGRRQRHRRPPARRPGERRGDGAMRDSVGAPAARAARVPQLHHPRGTNERDRRAALLEADGAGEIEISVADGVIVLEGHVISRSHRRFAGVLAWWTPGRRDVVNSLGSGPSTRTATTR